MVLVLAVVWGAFFVWWLRSHAQAGFGDSVGSFRRDLHVLERTAPVRVRPANRLRSPLAPPAAAQVRGAARLGAPRPVPPRVPARRQSVKRRRDVLFVLVLAVAATLVMAVATRSHALIALQLAADALLGLYVALLVRLRNRAAERELKLAYLPSATRRPVARQAAPEVIDLTDDATGPYALAGYGTVGLRRAAN